MVDTMKIEDRYLRDEHLVHFITHRFKRRFPEFDYDEMFSEANLAFTYAWDGFDPERGIKFSTYLCKAIRNRLIDFCRNETQHRETFRSILDFSIGNDKLVSSLSSGIREGVFYLSEFEEDLPKDSATIVQLIFDVPENLEKVVSGKGGHPMNWRSSILQYLEGLGWNRIRIGRAVKSLLESLVA